jgi:anti-sigma B factor antagonist
VISKAQNRHWEAQLARRHFATKPLPVRQFGATLLVSEKRPTMQLKLTAHKLNDGIVVVDCAGRIVFGEETSELREQVKGLISEGGRVVLNLGEVNYIDSGGLGTLVALYTSARSAGGAIKLARLTRRVDDLLQVTKLLTVFEVYETEEEAVESFRKAAAA